jgi:hypothetical protein
VTTASAPRVSTRTVAGIVVANVLTPEGMAFG